MPPLVWKQFTGIQISIIGAVAHPFTGNPQPPSAHTLSDEVQTLELTIAGMTCEGCASTLTKALSGIPGVVSARVSYKEKLAVVAMDRSTAVDTTTLNEAVKKAGYSILSIHHKESQ